MRRIVVLTVCLLLVNPSAGVCASRSADAGSHPGHTTELNESGHLPSVGPGEAPHWHPVKTDGLEHVTEIGRLASDLPPPVNRSSPKTVQMTLDIKEVVAPLADGIDYVFWTFGGTVPGPLLRARVGDRIELTLNNHPSSTHDHSIDLHAVTGPGGGAGLSQVAPGASRTLSFQAMHPGVYVYHCGTPNVPAHITNGLYGLIVIDPETGWEPVDREFYVMQGEIYTQGEVGEKGLQAFSPRKMLDEHPEYFVFNGRVGSLTGARALTAEKNQKIRIFFGNAGVSRPSNLHIIGEILDRVYPEASLSPPRTAVQTTLVPAGGATVVELVLENSGEYVLVDHALSRIDRGAYGTLRVRGSPAPALLRKEK